jgi:hypothetical protein
MFSPRQHLKMSQRLRRKASVCPNPGPLLRASAKFFGLAKLAIAKRLRQQPGQSMIPPEKKTCSAWRRISDCGKRGSTRRRTIFICSRWRLGA